MFTVTLIHRDGQTNVTRAYATAEEAEMEFDWRKMATPLMFQGPTSHDRPFIAVAMHAYDNPYPSQFHRFA